MKVRLVIRGAVSEANKLICLGAAKSVGLCWVSWLASLTLFVGSTGQAAIACVPGVLE